MAMPEGFVASSPMAPEAPPTPAAAPTSAPVAPSLPEGARVSPGFRAFGIGPAIGKGKIIGEPVERGMEPKTWAEGGATLGFALGGPLALGAAKLWPIVSKLPIALSRIIVGAAGGEAGGQAEGAPTGSGGAQGVIGGTLGTIVGKAAPAVMSGVAKIGGAVARKIPGGGALLDSAIGPTPQAALKTETAAWDAAEKVKAAAYAEAAAAYKQEIADRRQQMSAQSDAYRKGREATVVENQARVERHREAVAGVNTENRQRVEQYRTDLRSTTDANRAQTAAHKEAVAGVETQQEARNTAALAGRSGEIAGNIGQFAERVPPFVGLRHADQLEALARERQKPLGQYFQARVEEASRLIGPETTIRVPALNVKKDDMVMTQYGPMPAAMLGLESESERMTLQEASKKLANLRLLAYGGSKNDPTARTIAGGDSRKKYAEALGQIEAEVNSHSPEAMAAWTDGRKAMAVGSTLIDLLQKRGVFTRGAEGPALDPRRLQTLVSENRGWLRERMGPNDFKALIEAVVPGGRIGQADVAKSATGTPQFAGQAPIAPLPMPQAPTPLAMPGRPAMAQPPAPPALAPMPGRPAPPPRPARPGKPQAAPAPQMPPPHTSLTYPVDLPQIMINATVNRMLPR